MILDTVRAWSDWLGNGTYGVNALIPGLPLDGTDAAPPMLAAIVDETRSGPASRRMIPETLPALIVRLQEASDLSPSVGPNVEHRDADVVVATLYAANATSTEQGYRAAYYTLRAVQRSLAKFFDASIAVANTARLRNNVTIYSAKALQHITNFSALEDTDILAGLFITFQVRDSAP